MLRETPRSLRQYFALIAVLSFFPFVGLAVQSQWTTLMTVPMAMSFLFACLLAYIAVRFHALLPRPNFIVAVLTASFLWSLVRLGANMWRVGVTTTSVAVSIVSVLIYVYLVRSVSRLSREVSGRPSPESPHA